MLPIIAPNFSDEEIKATMNTLSSGWITQGPRVKEFEDAFAKYLGADHASAVTNCTSGLQLALQLVGVKPGDSVITASHSFIATANAIRACGAEPIFIDIDESNYNICPSALEATLHEHCESRDEKLFFKETARLAVGLSPLAHLKDKLEVAAEKLGKITAVLVVHQMGIPCDIQRIHDICKQYSLPLIEDAACAIGSKVRIDNNWHMLGNPIGELACFSFHPRKLLTTGEGGMLVSNNENFDRLAKQLRHHGMSLDDFSRHKANKVVFEDYPVSGHNFRLTDIQASLGLVQLDKLESYLEERRATANTFCKALSAFSWLKPFSPITNTLPNWQSFPVQLIGPAKSKQRQLMEFLLEKEISSRPGIMNAHEQGAYAAQAWKLPISEKTRHSSIILPLFPGMNENDINLIVQALEEFGKHVL